MHQVLRGLQEIEAQEAALCKNSPNRGNIDGVFRYVGST